jgi:hypothetical protein
MEAKKRENYMYIANTKNKPKAVWQVINKYIRNNP